MAKAPAPGSFDAPTPDKPAKPTRRYRLSFGGTTLEMPASMTFHERAAVREATGLTLNDYLRKPDEDSFQVLWWLARRYNGEPRLRLTAVTDSWPEDLSPDDVGLEMLDDGDLGEDVDDPES